MLIASAAAATVAQKVENLSLDDNEEEEMILAQLVLTVGFAS